MLKQMQLLTFKEVNSEGEINWALVTQFEACDARRALPCWDEPDRKAKFQVKLTIPKGKILDTPIPRSRFQKSLNPTKIKLHFQILNCLELKIWAMVK